VGKNIPIESRGSGCISMRIEMRIEISTRKYAPLIQSTTSSIKHTILVPNEKY
jgi:hypothetical protein